MSRSSDSSHSLEMSGPWELKSPPTSTMSASWESLMSRSPRSRTTSSDSGSGKSAEGGMYIEATSNLLPDTETKGNRGILDGRSGCRDPFSVDQNRAETVTAGFGVRLRCGDDTGNEELMAGEEVG